MVKKDIIITSALPYANGDLHLGHILEFIQTDIWVRYNKQIGNNCFYISGIDAHGTPVMLDSISKNISSDELINIYYKSHKSDIDSFYIDIDNYYTTHSLENKDLVLTLFKYLTENNLIFTENIYQLYDVKKSMFLPDRYITGKCPRCLYFDKCSDICSRCNYKYNSLELVDPISVVSDTVPIKKKTKQYFFNLKKFKDFLETWCKNSISQIQIINKLQEWFDSGLKNWDISRESPYFGFKIPGEDNKYFYVWLDAPIGYMASFKNLSDKIGLNFFDYWGKNSKVELYHFIGKDIIYFHTLFWPALLKGCDLKLPNDIYAHGFLTINGKKMSKSNGTFITAKKFLKILNPEYLRYYYASKLNNDLSDIDLNFCDFKNKINSDLIGKFINIISRCCKFINTNFNDMLSKNIIGDNPLFNNFLLDSEKIRNLYQHRQYSFVVNKIMKLATDINIYIDDKKPWVLIKNKESLNYAQEVCTYSINLFIILIINIKPILPSFARDVEVFFDLPDLTWENFKYPLCSKKIPKYKYFFSRINDEDIKYLSE